MFLGTEERRPSRAGVPRWCKRGLQGGRRTSKKLTNSRGQKLNTNYFLKLFGRFRAVTEWGYTRDRLQENFSCPKHTVEQGKKWTSKRRKTSSKSSCALFPRGSLVLWPSDFNHSCAPFLGGMASSFPEWRPPQNPRRNSAPQGCVSSRSRDVLRSQGGEGFRKEGDGGGKKRTQKKWSEREFPVGMVRNTWSASHPKFKGRAQFNCKARGFR